MSTDVIQTARCAKFVSPELDACQFVDAGMDVTIDKHVNVYYGRVLGIVKFSVEWYHSSIRTAQTLLKIYSVAVLVWALNL